MRIDGLGQINNMDTVKVNQTQAEAGDFESALQKAFDDGDKKKLKEACNEFESVMLKSLYKQMKATVPESGLVEKSSARSMFEETLDDELMDISSQRGMGLSEMMYKQLSAKMDNTYKVKSKENRTAPIEAESAAGSEASELNGTNAIKQKPDGVEPLEK